jgi:hypothetical protein
MKYLTTKAEHSYLLHNLSLGVVITNGVIAEIAITEEELIEELDDRPLDKLINVSDEQVLT